AAQIKAVLVKDEGLLVELKRWIAKEATDSGQVVEDSDLTEAAIFERLELDIQFRSVATRIVQRYGYLIPMANPESDAAKEKEFVLKERARRLVRSKRRRTRESSPRARSKRRGLSAPAEVCVIRAVTLTVRPEQTPRNGGQTASPTNCVHPATKA